MARGRWQRLLPRTYLTVESAGPIDLLRAATVFAGDGALLSGAAGLRLAGLDRLAWPRRVLVLVPPPNRTRSYDWVLVRRSHRPAERAPVDGPPCARIARSLADHALTLHRIDDVRAIVAEAVRRQLCTLDEIVVELADCPRNGSALLRQALDEVSAGAASAPEARAARLLRRAGLTGFEQNVPIPLPHGGHYLADFLWRSRRAILEIDSIEYHLGPEQWRATMDRHLVLETLGYSVIHRPPSALRQPAQFVADVRTWLTGRDQLARIGRGRTITAS